jgi:hypothetical protein
LKKIQEDSAPVMRRLGEIAVTDAEKFQMMNAQLENASREIGQALLPVMVDLSGAIADVAKQTGSVIQWFKENTHVMKAAFAPITAMIELNAKLIDGYRWLGEAVGIIDGKEKELHGNRMARYDDLEAVEQERRDALALFVGEEDLRREEELVAEQSKEAKKTEILTEEEKKRRLKLKEEEEKKYKDHITFGKLWQKYDKLFFNEKDKNRGLDFQSYQTWSSFMMNSMDKNNKTQFRIWKAFAIQQAIINTHAAAIAGYKAMVGIPIVGPGLAAAASAAAIIAGTMQVKRIAQTPMPAAEHGALISGSPMGTALVAGERNKSEAIIPLEDEQAQETLGGLGGMTVNINIENFFGEGDGLSPLFIDEVDKGLSELKRRGESRVL